MKAWRIYQLLTKWHHFNSLTEGERESLVALVSSIVAASRLEEVEFHSRRNESKES
jgi:hypothetical protein